MFPVKGIITVNFIDGFLPGGKLPATSTEAHEICSTSC